MEAFGHFLSSLFSRPRLTWAALALAAFALLMGQRLGIGPRTGAQFGETLSGAAWIIFVTSASFFILTIGIDAWSKLSKHSSQNTLKREHRSQMLRTAPQTRAIMFWMVVNSENSLWLMGDYDGLHDFIVKRLGYISNRQGSAVEIECSTKPYEWFKDNLDDLSPEEAGESARDELFASMDRARQELQSWCA